MQINRLTEIVFALINEKTVTAKTLAEKFNVSSRTIYRDIDILSVAGIPVYTDKGKGGGIKISDDFTLNKALLSKEEQRELIELLSMRIAAGNSKNAVNLLDKLTGGYKSQQQSIIVDFSSFCDTGGQQKTFDIINNAILSKKVIAFDYYNYNATESHRELEPLKLIYKHKSWYVYGFCRLRHEIRIFKFHRISNVIEKDEKFTREFDSQEFTRTVNVSSERKITIKFVVDKSQKARIYDEFDSNCIMLDDNDSFLVSSDIVLNESLIGYLMSFGENIKILEPKELAIDIAQRHLKASKV